MPGVYSIGAVTAAALAAARRARGGPRDAAGGVRGGPTGTAGAASGHAVSPPPPVRVDSSDTSPENSP